MIKIWRKGIKGAVHFTSPLLEACSSVTRIMGKTGTEMLASYREINKVAALASGTAYGTVCKTCRKNMENLVNGTNPVTVLLSRSADGEMPSLEEIADEAPMPVADPAGTATTDTAPRTREEWLIEAVRLLSHIFEAQGFTVPPVRISVGWPGAKSRKGLHSTIGQCWNAASAKDGVQQIFISPKLDNPALILATIMHELVHAVDGCKSDHKAGFKRIAVLVGLEGKMTATTASATLLAVFPKVLEALGKYDHAALNPGMTAGRVQTNKHLKMECGDCGYVARATAKQNDEKGRPSHCGMEMEEV